MLIKIVSALRLKESNKFAVETAARKCWSRQQQIRTTCTFSGLCATVAFRLYYK